jgi:predicted CXXCH cytochrome family protein
VLLIAAIAAGPGFASAADAPHDRSFTPGSCTTCHQMHNAPGASLTSVKGNANLCASCHIASAVPGEAIVFPWVTSDQAVPGEGGAHHRWDGSVTNGDAGASPPTTTAMQRYTQEGALQCSSCHNTHSAGKALAGSRLHASVQLATPLARHAALGGADPAVGDPGGRLVVNVPANAAPNAKGYLVQIVAAGPLGAATFRISNDNGASWWGCNGTSWAAYVAAPSNACTTGQDLPLNDGANVQVTFTGASFLQGDAWRFYVSYPFLRVSNDADALCLECHRSMRQGWRATRGLDPAHPPDGATLFSHPVGEGLNANGRGHDVATQDDIVDANGAPQAQGDGLATNDLSLVGGTVGCLTCHAVHSADSNSLSEDPR